MRKFLAQTWTRAGEATVRGMVALRSGVRREQGQGATEYALIIFLVAIAIIAAITALGGKIGAVFGQITNAL